MSTPPAHPVVGIWKTTWLPASQTFVRSQVSALERWDPLLFGLRREPNGIPMPVARAPFGRSRPARVLRRLSAATGYRYVYDDLLRRRSVQLVHAHFGPSAIEILPTVHRRGLPLVVTFHGYDVTRLPNGPRGAQYRRRLAAVFNYAHTLIAVSHFLAEELIALGAPPEKVTVRYIGTPAMASEPVADRAGITFVGRFEDGKGVSDLVRAVAALPPELLADTPVRMIGAGPLLEPIRRRVQELRLPIELLGQRTLAEVHETLNASRIFCAPSHRRRDGGQEAFGIVYLEAAQHGLPVVAYNHGGVPEAVADGRTGLLVPEGDVAALASSLQRLLTDPHLANQLGAAGAQRVHAEFDVRACTARLEDVYDAAVTGRR